MKRETTTLGTLAATALLALVLAACGGSATTTTSPTVSAQPTTARGATSAPATDATRSSVTSAPATDATSAPSTDATRAGATSAPATDATTAPAADATAGAVEPAAATKLNLNEVTEDQLMSTIPGFSSRMVREFMEYRPYISIQQFRKEIGKYVDANQVAAYEQYVYVPIDVDQADAETLQQLPGVDAAAAADLIAGRPYGSNQAFLAKLAERVPTADTAQAATYLAQ
jgi:DNA uptake protein ComE-like DNA-binding protein